MVYLSLYYKQLSNTFRYPLDVVQYRTKEKHFHLKYIVKNLAGGTAL